MFEKRSVWKPRKWDNPEQLVELINSYLEETEVEEYTVTWLCLYVWASKQLLLDYEEREWFKDIIKEAKLIVENAYEISLRKNWRTGDIFALKNFWWKDKSEVDNNTKLSVVWDVLSSIWVTRPNLTDDWSGNT